MVLDRLEERVKYIDPNNKTYSEYFDSILAFNRNLQKQVEIDLYNKFSKIEDGFVIATTGSDARLEKGPESLIEIVLYIDQYCQCNDVTGVVNDYLDSKNGLSLFGPIEIKDMAKDEMYYFKLNDEVILASPNRTLDAKALFGSSYLLNQAKKKLISEFDSKKFKKIKEKTKDHIKINSSGLQKYNSELEFYHYNLDEGIVNYNPSEKLWSFKQGPIRTVQYAIVRDIMKYSISDYDKSFMIDILSLPQNTVEKLNQMEIVGLSAKSNQEINDLTDSYKYFLWQYHRSQNAYNKGINSIEFDTKEVKERLSSIDKICRTQII